MSKLTLQLNIDFKHPVNAFALVPGGWYPLAFAPTGVLLLDKSILRMLPCLDKAPNRHDSYANKWWFEFLNNDQCTVNPILCAFEGFARAAPSLNEFKLAFDKACLEIKTFLPKAELIEFKDEHYEPAYACFSSQLARMDLEIKFLIEACPLVCQRMKGTELRRVEERLFRLRNQYGLQRCSLPFLLSLSCLYESKHGEEPLIGRKILKPSVNYSSKDAFNTLSDLRALEYLAISSGIDNVAFCTKDKYLAALWCALDIESGIWDQRNVTVRMTLGRELFPRLDDLEVNALYERIYS